jgi:hypothetical protein
MHTKKNLKKKMQNCLFSNIDCIQVNGEYLFNITSCISSMKTSKCFPSNFEPSHEDSIEIMGKPPSKYIQNDNTYVNALWLFNFFLSGRCNTKNKFLKFLIFLFLNLYFQQSPPSPNHTNQTNVNRKHKINLSPIKMKCGNCGCTNIENNVGRRNSVCVSTIKSTYQKRKFIFMMIEFISKILNCCGQNLIVFLTFFFLFNFQTFNTILNGVIERLKRNELKILIKNTKLLFFKWCTNFDLDSALYFTDLYLVSNKNWKAFYSYFGLLWLLPSLHSLQIHRNKVNKEIDQVYGVTKEKNHIKLKVKALIDSILSIEYNEQKSIPDEVCNLVVI